MQMFIYFVRVKLPLVFDNVEYYNEQVFETVDALIFFFLFYLVYAVYDLKLNDIG